MCVCVCRHTYTNIHIFLIGWTLIYSHGMVVAHMISGFEVDGMDYRKKGKITLNIIIVVYPSVP